jgi:hypothetical protein
MDVTLYNEAVSGSMAQAVMFAIFGFAPPLQLPGAPPRPGEGAREGREGRESRESRESRAQRLGAARAPARTDD